MPRARNLKPSFFKDAKVVSCTAYARLLFQGLWCLADYMGRLKYEPLEVKMEVFPADDVDIEALMAELSTKGLIEIYTDRSGSALVQVRGFSKHQNPHVNERIGKDKKPLPCLPSPEECKQASGDENTNIEQRVTEALVVLREYYESDPADSLNLIPDSLLPIPLGKPPSASGGKPPKRGTQLPDDFQPTDNHKALAAELGVSLISEFPKFQDHHRARGSTMKDWNSALNTWLRKAKDFQRGTTSGPPACRSGDLAGKDYLDGVDEHGRPI